MPENWTWDEMIGEFRALGGVADNICLKEGPNGRGLYPIDPDKPVHIHAPPTLLIPVEETIFDNGALRVKKESKEVGDKERKFFDLYEDVFSWGGGGRKDIADLIEAFEQLPANLRTLLATEFGFQPIFQGDKTKRIQSRFLTSRLLKSKGRRVLMPVVDLINHNVQGVSFQYEDGISVKATSADEVFVRYSLTDPLGVLAVWGFASDERMAFSLGMRLQLKSHRLLIRRSFNESQKLGQARAPIVKTEGDVATLSHLLLGHAKFPRLPKGIFYRLMQDIGEPDAEEVFDRIQHLNRMKVLKLRAALDGHDGAMIEMLRKIAQYQLEAMSYYVGARQI